MAQSPWTFDPSGRLGIWTGQSYDYSMPSSFSSSALTQNYGGPANFSGEGPYQTFDQWGLDVNGQQWTPMSNNYALNYDPQRDPNSLTLQIKSGDKAGTTVSYVKGADGNWTLDPNAVRQNYWDTNGLKDAWKMMLPIGAMGAAMAAPLLLGGEAAAGGAGAGMTAAEAAALGSEAAGGITGIGAGGMTAAEAAAAAGIPAAATPGYLSLSVAIPELTWGSASGIPLGAAGGAVPGLGALAPEAAGAWTGFGAAASGLPWGDLPIGSDPGGMPPIGPNSYPSGVKPPTLPGGGGSILPDWMQKALGITGALTGGGGSSTGGLIGAGIGGLLGYLDAKNQPNSLTVKNEIDPRLANLWYGADGTGGIAGQAANLYASQQGQPNPLMQAGQQISGMAGQTPDWATLVNQSKSQWDSNPWVKQQQDAITGKVTQNLLQNVMPNIGSGAESVGGYGGSRQGIAQGLAISNMNTDLAPALANLASNAYESSQNRALSSAGAAGSYGLNNQAQQAGLLGTGAGMQSSAPWANLNNFRTAISGAPGNTSVTQPLFNNTTAGALGGASLGSQIAGNINWGDLFKTIGGWNWPFGKQDTTGVF